MVPLSFSSAKWGLYVCTYLLCCLRSCQIAQAPSEQLLLAIHNSPPPDLPCPGTGGCNSEGALRTEDWRYAILARSPSYPPSPNELKLEAVIKSTPAGGGGSQVLLGLGFLFAFPTPIFLSFTLS